ncbi:hypothetical protein HHL10_20170 [Azohydromonas sp. G-1-1-14]|uniref:YCII-related domain-containing protein n=1 Tax=Azohydromonas caseinilytica TaxID=2728836 RepID=A0A848FE34_9BURK|nr:hypothetical protein [Azohydromonas caseinilytica]
MRQGHVAQPLQRQHALSASGANAAHAALLRPGRSKGVRVRASGSQRTVTDGPAAEAKALIAGFWIWEVESMQEAIEWVRCCPILMKGKSEIEMRQVFGVEDFGDEASTPEFREREERLRAIAHQRGAWVVYVQADYGDDPAIALYDKPHAAQVTGTVDSGSERWNSRACTRAGRLAITSASV